MTKWPLVTALNQSEQVREKVVECAQDLSTINQTLKHDAIEDLSLQEVEQALHQSAAVEVKVQECADDLSVVNQALTEEVTERKRLELALSDAQHLARHDAVTGLPNRSSLNDRLESALAQARRKSWRLAVMFIDLDAFKHINDTYGHDAGDKVLSIVSERLQGHVRDSDTVGRQGGDEFVYLMLEATDDRAVAGVATTIIELIAEPCEFDGRSVVVTPSVGIALFPGDGDSADLLLKNADSAMYIAKQHKRGYWFHQPTHP